MCCLCLTSISSLSQKFNVSVRQEAEKTFPPHVDCKGIHQLAFQHVGRRFHSKLTQDLREADMQEFLKQSLGKEVLNVGVVCPVRRFYGGGWQGGGEWMSFPKVCL